LESLNFPKLCFSSFSEKSSGKVFDVNDNDVTRESEGGDEPQGDDNSGEVEGNPEYFFIPSGTFDESSFLHSDHDKSEKNSRNRMKRNWHAVTSERKLMFLIF